MAALEQRLWIAHTECVASHVHRAHMSYYLDRDASVPSRSYHHCMVAGESVVLKMAPIRLPRLTLNSAPSIEPWYWKPSHVRTLPSTERTFAVKLAAPSSFVRTTMSLPAGVFA